jgi:hypothetical protein
MKSYECQIREDAFLTDRPLGGVMLKAALKTSIAASWPCGDISVTGGPIQLAE